MRKTTSVAAGLVAVIMFASPLVAQDKIGVAVCDQVLTKVTACIAKMPSAQQAQFKVDLEKLRGMWVELAGRPDGKPALEGVCLQVGEGLTEAMPQLGCAP